MTYYFDVADTPVGAVPAAQFEKGYYDIEQGTLRLNIESVREARPDEGGLNSPQLRYERGSE